MDTKKLPKKFIKMSEVQHPLENESNIDSKID